MGKTDKKSRLIMVVILLMVVLSGCIASGREMTIHLKEAKVNELIQAGNLSQELPFRIDRIDMQDGFIRVYMSYTKQDGSEMTGSYDLGITVQNGELVANITNLDMSGLQLDQKILDEIGQLMVHDFFLPATNLVGRVAFQAITITEDEMQIVIRIVP